MPLQTAAGSQAKNLSAAGLSCSGTLAIGDSFYIRNGSTLTLAPTASPSAVPLVSFHGADLATARLVVERLTRPEGTRLRVGARRANGGSAFTPWSPPVGAPDRLELHWAAAGADGAADGVLYLYGESGLLLTSVCSNPGDPLRLHQPGRQVQARLPTAVLARERMELEV